MRGAAFQGSKVHVLDVGKTESTMSSRDKEYLIAHNKRRKEWHATYGKVYVPLRWSKGLRDSSMVRRRYFAPSEGRARSRDPFFLFHRMASSLMFLVARRRCMLLVPADLRKIPPDHLRRRTTAGKKRNCCTPVKKALHLNSLCNRLVCFANQHAKNMPYGENIAR